MTSTLNTGDSDFFGASTQPITELTSDLPITSYDGKTTNINDALAYLNTVAPSILEKARLGVRSLGAISLSAVETLQPILQTNFRANEKYIPTKNVEDLHLNNYPLNIRYPNHDMDSNGIINVKHLTVKPYNPIDSLEEVEAEKLKSIEDHDDTIDILPLVHPAVFKTDAIKL